MTAARKQAYLLLLLNALIWGAAFPVVKPSFAFISPLQFLYLRYLIAAIIILPFLIALLYKHRPSLATIGKIISLEMIGAPLALGLLYTGLSKTSAIEASLIGSTYPILITLGGIFFLKEIQEKREWLGLSLSIVGTLILVIEPTLNGHQSPTFSLAGNLLILAHNFLVAGYYLTAKRFYKNQSKIMVTGLGYFASVIILGIFLSFQSASISPTLLLNPAVLTAAGYMGFFGSIIALTAYIKGQDLIEASEATLFTYLTGVFAIPFAYLILGETVTLIQLTAMAIIFLGVFLGEKRYNANS